MLLMGALSSSFLLPFLPLPSSLWAIDLYRDGTSAGPGFAPNRDGAARCGGTLWGGRRSPVCVERKWGVSGRRELWGSAASLRSLGLGAVPRGGGRWRGRCWGRGRRELELRGLPMAGGGNCLAAHPFCICGARRAGRARREGALCAARRCLPSLGR